MNQFQHLSRLELEHQIGIRRTRIARLNAQLSEAENELEDLEEALSANVNSDTPTIGRAVASLGARSVPPAVAGGYDSKDGGQQ